MRKAVALLLVGILACLMMGCNKAQSVKPLYNTKEALIAPIAGAAKQTIVVVPYDASAVGTTIGNTSTNIFWGIGKQKGAAFRLDSDIGLTIAEAFVFQLKQAGFNAVVQAKDKPQPAGVTLSGAISTFKLERFQGTILTGGEDQVKGEAVMTASLKNFDKALLYEGKSENTRKFAKAVLHQKSTATRTADEMLTALVDDMCKAPDFVAALQKLAAGG